MLLSLRAMPNRGLGGCAAGGGEEPKLLHVSQHVNHVPVLRQAAFAHDVDVDAGNAKLPSGGRDAHESAAIRPRVGPPDHYLVALSYDVFDVEAERVEGLMESGDACLQVGPAIALA